MTGSPDDQIEVSKVTAVVVMVPSDSAVTLAKITAVAVMVPPRRKRFVFPMKF